MANALSCFQDLRSGFRIHKEGFYLLMGSVSLSMLPQMGTLFPYKIDPCLSKFPDLVAVRELL